VAELVLPDLVDEAGELARAGSDVLRQAVGGSGRGHGAELGVELETRNCNYSAEQKDDGKLLHGD
jgi:hypothetical protein